MKVPVLENDACELEHVHQSNQMLKLLMWGGVEDQNKALSSPP
jgi:hypothetical protein